MGTKAIRVFYRKSDNQIVWTHVLRTVHPLGLGEFSTTVEQDLAEIPDKPKLNADGSVILDAGENTIKLGGIQDDYAGIEEQDAQRASDFLSSDENSIVDGLLIIGAKREV